MSTWVPSLPLGPGGFPIPNPGLGLLGPLIGGTVPVVANVLGAAIVSELLFPRTVADGTLDGARDRGDLDGWLLGEWGATNTPPAIQGAPTYPPYVTDVTGQYREGAINTIQFTAPSHETRQCNGALHWSGVSGFSGSVSVSGTGAPSVNAVPSFCAGTTEALLLEYTTPGGWRDSRTIATSGFNRYVSNVGPYPINFVPGSGSGQLKNAADLYTPAPVPPLERAGTRDLAPFTNPGDGAAQVGQVGTGAPALGEQVADAIAGAGVAVAAPPSPQLPGSSPVGVPGGGGGASSSPEGQQVTGTGVAGGSAPLAPAPLAPAPLPAPVLPGPAPLAPSTAPALPGTPTEAAPAGAPALPGSQPIDNTGNPVPPTLAPPAVTPPGQEMTPLGPVGGPAQQPAPTLQGIAAEVGKIEQKVLQLQRELQSPPGTGQLVPPWALPLLEALFSLGDGVTYSIPQPCGVDADGNPEPPVVITVPGDINQLLVIKNRIDGLAELIAVHKEIKQPVCVPTRAEGQGVSVTFEQVPGS